MSGRAVMAEELGRLGVRPGDVLFVHSSFKSLGPVEGGAAAVIGALEEAVGLGGLVLMPSFNLVDHARRAETWDVRTTPSTVGYLTEFFRTMEGTVRSDHYSHAVAARGERAAEFLAGGHLSREGMQSPWDKEPWGRTYGTHSPMQKAYDAGGKVLMLGVDYHSSTYMHFVETMYFNRKLATDARAKYRFSNRVKLGARWEEIGRISRGRVGQAECRLFGIREFVDQLLAEIERAPDAYLNA